MKITTLAQFEAFLKTRIPTREALFMGDIGLRRAKYFMKLLGNPQNQLKVIHIAGTSGKGSTAHLTSHLLQSQGFSVGLSISPHVFDIRERMQVFCFAIASRTRTTNAGHTNALPSEKLVLKYFNQILPTILQMEKCKFGMPTFFEINVALAYFMFAQEKLDYAIMETGLGGTLDATNTVTTRNKICIITKIGLDHTEILGKTISKITEQKAGIVGFHNSVISHQSAVSALRVINLRCEKQNARLHIIKPNKNFSIISSTPEKTIFDFSFSSIIPGSTRNPENSNTNRTATKILNQVQDDTKKIIKIEKIELGLIGKHQAENCSLALSCLSILSKRDKFSINEKLLRSVLCNIKIPGRFEICKTGGQTIIIDGAHNPQKMEALTSNLARIYPSQKFNFIVAFKKGKDYKSMLKLIIPLADKILLTQFSTSGMDNHWNSTDNQEISAFLKSQYFKNFKTIPNKHSDILENVRMSLPAGRKGKNLVVITGSLYLVSSIYPYLKK